MRTDITHLPEQVQTELVHIIRLLVRHDKPVSGTGSGQYPRPGRVRHLILHDCFTEGHWQPDTELRPNEISYRYNIMVIISRNQPDIFSFLDDIETKLNQSDKVSFPVSLDISTQGKLNRKLESGYLAYDQIPTRGILLYSRWQTEDELFSQPDPVSADEHHIQAREHFNRIFPLMRSFLSAARLFQARSENNVAAFLLTMAAEQAYLAFMLVHILNYPSSRALHDLRELAESIHPELHIIWAGSRAQRSFELLTSAFQRMRYTPDYRITNRELDVLFSHVEDLHKVTHYICQMKLSVLKSGSLEKSDQNWLAVIKAAMQQPEDDSGDFDTHEVRPFCQTDEQEKAFAELGDMLFDMTIPLFELDSIADTMKCMAETGKKIEKDNISLMGQVFHDRAIIVRDATHEMLDLWRSARAKKEIASGMRLERLGD